MPVRDLLFARKGKAGNFRSRMSAPFGNLFFWLDLEPFCGAFYGPRRVVALDPHLLIGTRGSEVWLSKICWGNCHNAILFQLVLVVRYDGLEIYLAFIGRQSEWI